MKKLIFQPFHLVTLRPWPIFISLILIIRFINSIYIFHYVNRLYLIIRLIILILIIYQWWRDVVRERTFQGYHTLKVLNGIKFGIILFIVSEVFFFIRIFWCYFHIYLSPRIEIGCLWPPKNIISFNPYYIPLLNTVILLSSGVRVTLCHYSLINKNKFIRIIRILITIILGFLFSYYQYIEYKEAYFCISDSIYGSIFFIATGFHGLHVLVGTLFLIVNYYRIILNNYSFDHHFGFEGAAWYWHFVDLVWLFLYLLVYYWSN